MRLRATMCMGRAVWRNRRYLPALVTEGRGPGVTDRICLVANSSSDRNSRGDTAFAVAMAVFGDGAALRRCAPGSGIARRVRGVLAAGFGTIVAAGRDGTVVAVAQSLIGTPVRMGILPLGTFNCFACGLGLP